MATLKYRDENNYLVLTGSCFERVNMFKHLGTTISKTNEIEEEMKAGIRVDNRSYWSLKNILQNKNLSRSLKVQDSP